LNGPQDLRLIDDARVPHPGPGEVLIRVTAAGVDFVDILPARSAFAGGSQPPYPAGIEGAGEVVAVGAGVTGVESGAHVVGAGIMGGAFAEYLVLPAAAAIPVPLVSLLVAGAVGLVAAGEPVVAAAQWPAGPISKPWACSSTGQRRWDAQATGRPRRRAERTDPRRGRRDRPGRGDDGQALWRDGDRHGVTGKHETVRELGADYILDAALNAGVDRCRHGVRQEIGQRTRRVPSPSSKT
jgi:NADPH2:quinone reductase